MKKEIKIVLYPEIHKSKNGELFEKLMRITFEYEGYTISPNINFTGLEIDLLGKHITRDEKLLIECKAKQKPLSTEIKNFAFNVRDQDADYGYFLYTEELDHQAAGLVENMKNKGDKYKNLFFFGPDSIINTLVRATLIRSFDGITFPENLLINKVIFVYSFFGNFYIFLDVNSPIVKNYYLFDALTLTEIEDVDRIIYNQDAITLSIDQCLRESISEISLLEHKYIRPKNAKKAIEVLTIDKKFEKYINDIGVTFIHNNVDEIDLNSIFVEPYLKKISPDKLKKRNYNNFRLWDIIDAEIDNSSEDIRANIRFIFTGAETSCKTTICKRLFQRYFHQGFIPILINGSNIKNIRKDSFHKDLDDHLKLQYVNLSFSEIKDKSKIVLIIDDFHKFKSQKQDEFRDVFIKNINSDFENIILVGDTLMPLNILVKEDKLKDIFESYKTYQILEFGPKLRHELVEKWTNLGQDVNFIDPNDLYRKYDEIERQIETIIGKNYIPVFPFYILTILQTLEAGVLQNQNYSIHGFYYEHIINKRIISVIKNSDDISLIYNYITELAFLFFQLKKRKITLNEFEEFHELYCYEYKVNTTKEAMLKDLSNAKLVEVNGEIGITYKYIYYFFVAKNLSNKLNDSGIKEIVSRICKKVYRDENSSIVMFLTHLSKDPFIMNELIENSKLLFKDTPIIKLNDDILGINKLIKDVPKQVLELVDSKDKRKEELQEKEKVEMIEKEYEEIDDENEEDSNEDITQISMVSKITMALKTIEILGQLTKKNWGSMNGDDKYKIASETYFLGLRALNYYIKFVEDSTDSITNFVTNLVLKKHITDRFSLKKEIEDTSNDIIFRFCFLASFGFIKRVSNAIGYDKLSITFESILERNNFTSVKLIDLSIKLDHFNKFPVDLIKQVNDDLDGNYLSSLILRNLVIDYFYLFTVSYKEKQKICSILNIEMKDQRMIEGTSVVRKE